MEHLQLDKRLVAEILATKVENIKKELDSALLRKSEETKFIDYLYKKFDNLNNLMIKLIEDRDVVQMKDYISQEDFENYQLTLQTPKMLCEFDIPFHEWLGHFYEDLPFIQNKHLIFVYHDGEKFVEIPMSQVDNMLTVKVNHADKQIYLEPKQENEPIIYVNLISVDLYYVLCLSYQKEVDDKLVQDWELVHD